VATYSSAARAALRLTANIAAMTPMVHARCML
jgi:hypothetical protein